MKKNFSKDITPETSEDWKNKTVNNRIDIINQELKKDDAYKDFNVIDAPDNGQIVLKIERKIPANERGLFLLKLEERLKSAIDKGITIWLEPVGDKSKLRQLRGIKFN